MPLKPFYIKKHNLGMTGNEVKEKLSNGNDPAYKADDFPEANIVLTLIQQLTILASDYSPVDDIPVTGITADHIPQSIYVHIDGFPDPNNLIKINFTGLSNDILQYEGSMYLYLESMNTVYHFIASVNLSNMTVASIMAVQILPGRSL